MAIKFFTSETFEFFANKIRAYVDRIASGKADTSHVHVVANITDLSATAQQLNYMNDVTSNVQAQFDSLTEIVDSKANSSHPHYISDIDNLQSLLNSKVPATRTVNNKELSSDVTLSASDVGADASGTATSKISSHDTSTSAHSDIRDLITGLTTRLNTLADSDDTTLDQMSEVVAYIKSNKSLIDGVTTTKVNVTDIINDLTTNVSNKPLSAAQGVAIKSLIDTLQAEVDSKSTVSFSRSLTSGTKVGTITIDGTGTDLYAPTNTHYTTGLKVGASATATANAAVSNGSVYLNVLDDSTVRDSHKITGSGSVTVSSDVNGAIIIKGVDTTYTALKNPYALTINGNATAAVTYDGSAAKSLNIVPGSNVTITTDATNSKITIAATDTKYTNGNGLSLSGTTFSVSYGTSASALGTSSAGSATTVSRSDHVHALPALTSCTGTLTIAKGGTGATTAAAVLTNLGITATAAELNKLDGVTATTAELNYTDGVTSNIQTQLNALSSRIAVLEAVAPNKEITASEVATLF